MEKKVTLLEVVQELTSVEKKIRFHKRELKKCELVREGIMADLEQPLIPVKEEEVDDNRRNDIQSTKQD